MQNKTQSHGPGGRGLETRETRATRAFLSEAEVPCPDRM